MVSNGGRSGLFVFFWVILCGLGWLGVATLFLWGCVNNPGPVEERPSAKVCFVDVGQGLAVLLEQEKRFAMYDVGPDSVGIWDTLRVRGIDTLEWVVVSHNHRDHGGGLLELMETPGESAGIRKSVESASRVHIRRLYVGPDTSGDFVRDSSLRVARRLGISVDTLYRGDRLSLGRLSLKVLWPPSFLRVGDNGASLVMNGSLEDEGEGRSFLLTGDLDAPGEKLLMELSPNIRGGLLQVGHHGSAGSSTLDFLNQVSPQLAVISVGAKNRYGHPTAEVLRKLEYILENPADSTGRSDKLFRTDQDGTVCFRIIPDVGFWPEN